MSDSVETRPGRPIRVLHCPELVGGHAPQLAKSERAVGLESRSVTILGSAFGYEPDEVLSGPGVTPLRREIRRWKLLWRALTDFNVVHFNFGESILPCPAGDRSSSGGLVVAVRNAGLYTYRRAFCLRDLAWLKSAGRAVFVTYQGDDARQGDYCRAHFDIHFVHEVDAGYYPAGSDERKRRSIAQFALYADGIYALNPDLLHLLPKRAEFLPYASVDIHEWRPRLAATGVGNRFIVVHAPSHRAVKGTRYVTDAANRLKAEGHDLDLLLVENLPRSEARTLYERADVVVDQLLAGWYGGLAVEVMALGKPVVAYIRDGDLRFIPQAMREALPVIRAEPSTIYQVLKDLLTRRRRELPELGARSRRYVEDWHDPLAIASRLKKDYQRALGQTK